MPDDVDILTRIHALVAEEHELAQEGADPARRRVIEEQLDQCWDLLRQRRAKREFGQDPGSAQPRAISDVEHYLQ